MARVSVGGTKRARTEEAATATVAVVEPDPRNEVQEEVEKFVAYCRRGNRRRRVELEDRHVANVALGGDGRKNVAEFAVGNMPKFMAKDFKKVNGGEINQRSCH